jgi:GNAT superfamily N-acetyltransferase
VKEALEFLESEDLCVVDVVDKFPRWRIEIWQCGVSRDDYHERSDDIEPIAYISLGRHPTHLTVMDIHYFGVHRDWRGVGIGEALTWVLKDYLIEMPRPVNAIWTDTTSFGVIRLRSKVFGPPVEVDDGISLLSPEEVKEWLPEGSPEQSDMEEGYGRIESAGLRVVWLVHDEPRKEVQEAWAALDG